MSADLIDFSTKVKKPARPATQAHDNIMPARLAERVNRLRAILSAIQIGEQNVQILVTGTIKSMMAAGDELLAIKHEVRGRFGAWLKANVSCTSRTATNYMRLAKGRAIIEAEIGNVSDLSLRAALKLLSKKKPKKETIPEAIAATKIAPPASLSAETFRNATPEEQARYLDDIGLKALLRGMSKAMLAELNKQAETTGRRQKRVKPAISTQTKLCEKWTGAGEAERTAFVRLHATDLLNRLDAVTAGKPVTPPGTSTPPDPEADVPPSPDRIN